MKCLIDRLDIPQEFILDRFHLHRAAKRAFQNPKDARRIVWALQEQGLKAVKEKSLEKMAIATDKKKERIRDFYRYVHNDQDSLLDLQQRGYSRPVHLGAIEGNEDKSEMLLPCISPPGTF